VPRADKAPQYRRDADLTAGLRVRDSPEKVRLIKGRHLPATQIDIDISSRAAVEAAHQAVERRGGVVAPEPPKRFRRNIESARPIFAVMDPAPNAPKQHPFGERELYPFRC